MVLCVLCLDYVVCRDAAWCSVVQCVGEVVGCQDAWLRVRFCVVECVLCVYCVVCRDAVWCSVVRCGAVSCSVFCNVMFVV